MNPSPMPKDICCQNFKGLIAYIRHHYGDDGVRRLTDGLLDGRYFVRDKFAPERVKQAQDLGAGRYIPKPYTFAKLGQVIRDELIRR